MTFCANQDEVIDAKLDALATQYRESRNLINLIVNYMRQVGDVHDAICDLPEHFDIDTAVGLPLTIVGKWLGWPRDHCGASLPRFFGFDIPCGDPDYDIEAPYSIGGFDGIAVWEDGSTPGAVDYTFEDDELYRRFLKSRAISVAGETRRRDLHEAAKILIGPEAHIESETPGHVIINFGRCPDEREREIFDLMKDVLPIAVGVGVTFTV